MQRRRTRSGTGTTDGKYHLFKITPDGVALEVSTWWPTDGIFTGNTVTGTYSGGLEALPDGRIAIRVDAKRAGSPNSASPFATLVIVFDPVAGAPQKVLRLLPPGYTSSTSGRTEVAQIFCKIPGANAKTLIASTLVMSPGELNNASSSSDTLLTFLDL